jgi:hypothetical protein
VAGNGKERAKWLKWLEHQGWTGIGVILALVVALVPIVWRYGPFKGSGGPSPVPDQVRQIERTEHKTRGGFLQNVQSVELHGDGTRSWVFVFGEGKWSRLVIYDVEHGRLREGIVLTSRVRPLTAPAEVSFNGIPYRRLSPSRKREARKDWLLLHTPTVSFDKPSALQIADGSRMLLIPTIAFTASETGANLMRQTVVAVFWAADRGEYVVGYLFPDFRRWTVPRPSDLRLELRPGSGFHALPVATEVTIDSRARLVFAIVGAYIVQVHAFQFPRGPEDLEECPVLWRGAAPIGPRTKLRQLEHELVRGCPIPS